MTSENINPEIQHLQWMDGAEQISLIHRGKWANANVYRFCKENQCMVRKCFCTRSFLVRWTIGILLTWREVAALRQLSRLSGIPDGIQRCSAFALRYRYMEGVTIGSMRKKKLQLPKSYFIAAEKLLGEMHHRKMVHLDLRRANNWIVQPDGKPGIIDFQSMVSVAMLPRNLQKKLYAIDYSGLYKFWEKMCKEELDPERRSVLNQMNRVRRFWVFKGYAFPKFKERK